MTHSNHTGQHSLLSVDPALHMDQFAACAQTTLTTLIYRLDSTAQLARSRVLKWGCPVPAFGDLGGAHVATLGLNPSNREFVDNAGRELEGPSRRFPTLRSLQLRSWSDVSAHHLSLILESCLHYFHRNPYDAWFRKLDFVLSGINASYYGGASQACHLDLIPYATTRKWTELATHQRRTLLSVCSDTLALLLRDSPIRVLILNGRSVINHFNDLITPPLDASEIPSWALARGSGLHVKGIAYRGVVSTMTGVPLGRDVLVLGFNHNLQSSFGVSREVIRAIRDWIGEAAKDAA